MSKKRMRLKRLHKMLLQEKNARIGEALQMLRAKQADFDITVNEVKDDLGISEKNYDKWTLSKDGEAIEEVPKPKEPEKPPEEEETQGDKKEN